MNYYISHLIFLAHTQLATCIDGWICLHVLQHYKANLVLERLRPDFIYSDKQLHRILNRKMYWYVLEIFVKDHLQSLSQKPPVEMPKYAIILNQKISYIDIICFTDRHGAPWITFGIKMNLRHTDQTGNYMRKSVCYRKMYGL